jgi:hypothetical protein
MSRSIDGVCRLPRKYKGPDGEKWPTVFASVPHTHGLVSSDRGTLARVVNIEHTERQKLPYIVVILEIFKSRHKDDATYLGGDG